MTTLVDVAIIGAGPYGLSIAAHLREAGIEHRIFGEPMDFWQQHMPPGMKLKSDGSSSDLSDPERRLTLAAFCRERGFDHHPRLRPVPIETFIAYGREFQARFAPQAEAKRLVTIADDERGHRLEFEQGEGVIARRVIVATGILPYVNIPSELTHLPSALASHSSEYGPLDRLAGREVVIVGGGASALDLAALLDERGAAVTVVARTAQVELHSPPRAETGGWLEELRYPSSKIGGGWLLRFCDDGPQLIHLLPERVRLELVRKVLGPSGGWFVRDRVLGRLPLKYGREIERAEVKGARVVLHTVARDGTREATECDHLLMATGYRVNLDRLTVLTDNLRARLRTVEKTPVLSANFETSVRGLYFAGTASANSFGPVMRFACGAVHPARRLARHLPRALLRRTVALPAMAPG
jgi:thioredoxin reductase